MNKVQIIEQLNVAKQQLHELKLQRTVSSDTEVLKQNNRQQESLYIQIKKLKNELRLIQSMDMEFGCLSMDD